MWLLCGSFSELKIIKVRLVFLSAGRVKDVPACGVEGVLRPFQINLFLSAGAPHDCCSLGSAKDPDYGRSGARLAMFCGSYEHGWGSCRVSARNEDKKAEDVCDPEKSGGGSHLVYMRFFLL